MRSRRMSPSLGRGALAVAMVFAALSPACNEKAAPPRACCDQPRTPPGVPPFTVVADDVTGPSDGQDVKMRVAFKQKTKHDDVYAALQFLYRYAMTRNTFEPTNFVGESTRRRRSRASTRPSSTSPRSSSTRRRSRRP